MGKRRIETSATCFDCSLSQEIFDGDKRLLTPKDLGFDFREAVDPIAELAFPEPVECVAMAFP